MYLTHFNLKTLPFTITPNLQFYCDLPAHQAALNLLLIGIRNREGFIKITGEVGCGKTLLCRMLLKKLHTEFVTAYIPNPQLTPIALQKAIAQELSVTFPPDIDQHHLIDLIYQKLLAIHADGKAVVLVLDEAQSMSVETLEALRLLTNLETETTKLLQIVLFGQPELDEKLRLKSLRQMRQRISFSYFLPAMSSAELNHYLQHRLAIAGHTYGYLFTTRAKRLLLKGSRGIPRLINLLCHKGLLISYGLGEKIVGAKAIKQAILETEGARRPGRRRWFFLFSIFTLFVLFIMLLQFKKNYGG